MRTWSTSFVERRRSSSMVIVHKRDCRVNVPVSFGESRKKEWAPTQDLNPDHGVKVCYRYGITFIIRRYEAAGSHEIMSGAAGVPKYERYIPSREFEFKCWAMDKSFFP